jgi:hypothetical protein
LLFRSTNNGSSGASLTYTHNQTIPQNIWNITHNLGKNPHIDFYDENGRLFIAYYEHIDNNNSKAIMNVSGIGTAECLA